MADCCNIKIVQPYHM